MRAHVRLEVPFFVKCLVAVFERADIVPNARVLLQVDLKALINCKALAAASHRASELLDGVVGLEVTVEMPLGNKCLAATQYRAAKKALILIISKHQN